MRVSREKKQEKSQGFIDAFVAEVRRKGYTEVSLRDVARAAGLSDGAIYKHFPSKEKILLAYYAAKMNRLRAEGDALARKPGYTLMERLQGLLEFQIGQYEGEKDFLEKTFQPTFIAASLMWSEVAAMRKTYVGTVRDLMVASNPSGGAAAQPWPGVVDEMIWCHYMAVMLYWLRDGSDRREDTTQFIDRTLNLFGAVVTGPLLPLAQDLVGFLVNRHLMPLLLNLGGAKPGGAWGFPGAGRDASGSADASTGKAKATGRANDKGKSKGERKGRAKRGAK